MGGGRRKCPPKYAVAYERCVCPCRTFEFISDYCDSHCNMIPIGFVLAFYVSMVVNRFWEQFEALPWTMRLGTLVTGSLHGEDDVSRMTRRTVVRYAVLCYTVTMISVAPSAKKRFPTMQHLVNAGAISCVVCIHTLNAFYLFKVEKKTITHTIYEQDSGAVYLRIAALETNEVIDADQI